MSAHPVSNDMINFLLAAAMSCGRRMESVRTASFTWSRKNGGLEELTPDSVQRTGQMLREENTRSVRQMLERAIPAPGMPNMTFPTTHLLPVGQPKLAEILKATDYYEYQSSRHPGWWESDAREFIECLRHAAWMNTPEYRRTVWGEPPHIRSYFRAEPEPENPVAGNPPTDWSRVRRLDGIPGTGEGTR